MNPTARIKALLLALATYCAAMLASCTPNHNVDRTQEKEANVIPLSEATLGGNKVVEFVSPSNPSQVIVAVDGYYSSGIVSFDRDTRQEVGQIKLLNKFNTAAGTVYEFTPASDTNIVCTYVDSYKSGAMTYSVKK